MVLERLNERYPETPVPLDNSDAFTFLIAVLLSAQCTDNKVNEVTPALFAAAPDAVIIFLSVSITCSDEILFGNWFAKAAA